MTKEDISRIIKESRIAAGLTQTQVAERLGRPQATIAGWEVGRSQPDANTLFELFRVLGRSVDEAFGFTVESFNVTARERMHIEKYRALDAYGQDTVSAVLDWEHKRCTAQTRATSEVERLVYVNPAAAGSPLYAESDFERLTFPESDVPPGADFGIRISGHSMEPTVPDGCIAWVHKTVNLDDGAVGIFMLNDSAVCKRCFRDGGTLRLESDNPDYGPVEVHEADSVILVGEVIGTV